MEPTNILRTDPLDLLFENRNKSYGAYTLRKYYNQRLYMSMGITFSAVILICFFIYMNFHALPGYVKPPEITDVFLDNIKPPAPMEKPLIPAPRVMSVKLPATITWSTPVIVPDQNVPKPPATIDQLDASAIGTQTVAGPPDNGLPNSGGTRSGTGMTNTDSAETAPRTLEFAEIMPEFPGGIEALKRFLMKNLRMPDEGLEPGSQVKVIARFVVGTDGKVRDVEIVQPADAVFNKEVRRVISKMPDWKPGVQNHRNVSVYFNLPVNFVGAE